LFITTPTSKFVLRVYRQNKKSKQEVLEEIDFAHFLSLHEVPVPGIINNLEGDAVSQTVIGEVTWQSLLMEFRAGAHPDSYTNDLLSSMAALQARIHLLGGDFANHHPSVKPAPTALAADSMLRQLKSSIISNDTIAKLVERAASFRVELDPNLPRGFSHFDFDRGNMLVADGAISAVLDFDDTKYAPLITCLANTLWNVLASSQGDSEAQLYIQTYQQTRPLTALELQVLPNLILYRHYVICAMDVAFGLTEQPNINECLVLERRIKRLVAFPLIGR
jgi:Ser/Thr protein kinase RdoA (MazF antagonist)